MEKENDIIQGNYFDIDIKLNNFYLPEGRSKDDIIDLIYKIFEDNDIDVKSTTLYDKEYYKSLNLTLNNYKSILKIPSEKDYESWINRILELNWDMICIYSKMSIRFIDKFYKYMDLDILFKRYYLKEINLPKVVLEKIEDDFSTESECLEYVHDDYICQCNYYDCFDILDKGKEEDNNEELEEKEPFKKSSISPSDSGFPFSTSPWLDMFCDRITKPSFPTIYNKPLINNTNNSNNNLDESSEIKKYLTSEFIEKMKKRQIDAELLENIFLSNNGLDVIISRYSTRDGLLSINIPDPNNNDNMLIVASMITKEELIEINKRRKEGESMRHIAHDILSRPYDEPDFMNIAPVLKTSTDVYISPDQINESDTEKTPLKKDIYITLDNYKDVLTGIDSFDIYMWRHISNYYNLSAEFVDKFIEKIDLRYLMDNPCFDKIMMEDWFFDKYISIIKETKKIKDIMEPNKCQMVEFENKRIPKSEM